MRKLLLIVTHLMTLVCGAQQIPHDEIDLAKIIDDIAGAQPETGYEILYDNLLQVMQHPINLNKTTAEELDMLRILTSQQISSIIDYRNQYGDFLSIYELQSVPYLDLHSIMRLYAFVVVPDSYGTIDMKLLDRVIHESDNYLMIRTGWAMPFARDSLGTGDRTYVRYRSSRSGDFSIGFTAEKDAGERYRWSLQDNYLGLDYTSFHAQIQNKRKLENLIIGDFQSQFGQGIMLGGIMGTGKGSEAITTIRRSNIGFMPYTSAYESGNMRGIAVAYRLSDAIRVSAFASRTRHDANIVDSIQTTNNLQATGIHRTESELQNRRRVSSENLGFILGIRRRNLELGAMFNHYNFSVMIDPSPSAYNHFAFRGSGNSNVGAYAFYNAGSTALFGEFAHSLDNGIAWVAGALISISPAIELSLLARSYDADFYARFSNAFGEASTPQNEKGMYWGLKFKINRRFLASGYVDLFQFPWLRYRVYRPSTGYETLVRLTYQPSKNASLFIQYRYEHKVRNAVTDSPEFLVNPFNKSNLWLHAEAGLLDKIRFRTRLQLSEVDNGIRKSRGMAIAQDVKMEIWKLQFTGRYVIFDTDDYDNRQYMYENDVLLAFSMPAYAGRGVRRMMMVRYKFSRHWSCWIRYATTRLITPEKITADHQLIAESLKNDIKFQLQFTF